MANRIFQRYNSLLNEATSLEQYYSKSYITGLQQTFINLQPNQYWMYDGIDSFLEIGGFELYSSATDNEQILNNVAYNCIQIAAANHSPISLHFINQNQKLRLMIGIPGTYVDTIKNAFTGNLSAVDIKLHSSLFSSEAQRIMYQKYTGTVVGSGQISSFNIDMGLNALENVDYLLSIMAFPFSNDFVQNELSFINTYLDEYESITKGQLSFGNNARHDVTHTNNDIYDLVELLKLTKQDLMQGMSRGLWRTYITICAPEAKSYSRVYSAISTTLHSYADAGTAIPAFSLVTVPNSVFRNDGYWCLPRAFVGTREYGRIYSDSFSNVLTSESLSSFFHLPIQNHYGYRVQQYGRSRESIAGPYNKFAPDVHAENRIALGTVEGSGQPFYVPLNALRQHVFITGFTQCGKSTTMQHIISEIVNEDVPFIVIESAKKQYCELLGDSRLSGKMKVYSGGYDTTLLQINPFQPETGTILDNHIQSLVALFVSIFDEPAPLPQIINLLVHKVYTSTGWNSKDRIKPNEEREYPTINTMIQLIDEVIDEIRYSSKYPETAENMRGVIRGRLLSIIQGAMNDVLNTTNNISIEEMFSTSAVVELDDFAETNKTFMSGLLALKTYEYSRNSDYGSKTKRLLIIEEAHNIVPNTEQKRVSSNIAMCSNHFTSMLAEVAAYGTGLVIIDQRPTAVSPAVVANTGTKIIHNLQAGEDKTAVGASLGLTETEVNMISDLKVGQAIVKIPNSSEKCRVNINRNLIEANVVNWGVLFLGSNQQRYISPGVAPSERSYFLSCGSSAEAIINCLSFAELRLHRLMDFPEKMLYAGELLNTIKTSVRNKRQILYEVFEVVR